MIPTRSIAQICLAGILCGAPFAVTAQVKFFGVGDLPGGIVQSQVRDTAKVGNVLYAVGGSAVDPGSTGNDAAFLWTSTGGITALPQLVPGLTGTNPIIGSAITPDAVYIAARARWNPSAAGQRRAVRVTTSGLALLDLGFLPGFPQQGFANAISNDGSILYGIARYEPGGLTQAVRFTAAGPTIAAIPFLNPGDNQSGPAPRGTSSDGSVMVGTSATNSNGSGPGNAAFRYIQGVGVSAIPLLAGGTWSAAIAVSPNGNLALVGGDSTAAPNGEVYLYNATASTVTPLGSPALGFGASTLGGMTFDGSVVALTFGSVDDPYSSGFVRNSAGWHDVRAILANAGVNLAGWSIGEINGMSSDGTRLWGSGAHNGNVEGWLAEFPAGYLAAYAASLPAQSIVGSWSTSDNLSEGANVISFLDNGTYIHIQDATTAEGPSGFDGYERGTYSWDPVTKAFTLTTLVDLNGDIGLSGISGQPGMTMTSLNNIITLNVPAAGGPVGSAPLVVGSSPIVGGWVLGDSTQANSTDLIVFFANGTYLMADDSSPGDATNHPGIERGTYTWDQGTGAFTATAIVDTNGNRGLSGVGAGVTVAVAGNTLTFTVPSQGAYQFARVVAPPLSPSVVVAESRRDHAASGPFDLVLGTVTTNPTTEPRFGPVQSVVFTFDKPVTAGVAVVTEGTALAGASTFSGSQMTVPLTSVANAQYVTVAVSGVTSADGGTGGGGSIRLGFLAGDVDQNRVVSLGDLVLVNTQVAQQVTTANFLTDVNASGTLSFADKGLTNTRLISALPLP